MTFEEMVNGIRSLGRQKVAVVSAENEHALEAAREAYDAEIAQPVLIGNIDKIDAIARQAHIDISPFEIIDSSDDYQSVAVAVTLARDDKVDVLLKGNVKTATLLSAILKKENGLRTGGTLSYVGIAYIPKLSRMIFYTDAALIPYPDLDKKVHMINNAVSVARSMGVEKPRVAVIAAVEVVNPDMPPTLDAAALTVMNQRGQIKDCYVDGPLAMDVALSEDSARIKGVHSEVAGKADIFLFPNIETANCVAKTFTVAADFDGGGLLVGAKTPVVITSRADEAKIRLYSLASAIHYAKAQQK